MTVLVAASALAAATMTAVGTQTAAVDVTTTANEMTAEGPPLPILSPSSTDNRWERLSQGARLR